MNEKQTLEQYTGPLQPMRMTVKDKGILYGYLAKGKGTLGGICGFCALHIRHRKGTPEEPATLESGWVATDHYGTFYTRDVNLYAKEEFFKHDDETPATALEITAWEVI